MFGIAIKIFKEDHYQIKIRDHPFNFKGGGGYVFFGVKIVFSLRSAAELFFQDIIFSYKTIFFKAKIQNCRCTLWKMFDNYG